jgi:anti-sigma factor RsiW
MGDTHEDVRALFEAYSDGALPAAELQRVEDHLMSCVGCEQAFERFQREQTGLSGMNRLAAPQDFDRTVAEVIRRRSDGRFFGRRAFGDRVPYEILAAIAIAVALVVYVLIRVSGTGSLKLEPGADRNVSDEAVKEGAPKP